MGLLDRDPSVAYRGGILPYLARTVTDPGDDITEYEQLEWATPSLLYDPVRNMALTGAMLRGHMPVDEGLLTQTMVDAPLVGGLLSGAAGAVPRGAVLGANVFHGGPHRWSPEPDFPHGRPRLDKIGTGEGAQAYGYGFYSAESEGVARHYASKLGSGQTWLVDEGVVTPSGNKDPIDFAVETLAKGLSGEKRAEVEKAVRTAFSGMSRTELQDTLQRHILPKAREGLPRERWSDYRLPYSESLYKLDIPDADVAKYLDNDKPLSEQPKSVRDALKNIDIGKSASVTDADGTARRYFEDFSDMSGGGFVDALTQKLGSQQAASEALRKAGIPGLKYFDQDSRPLGDTIGQTLVVRGKEIDSDDLTGSFAANRLLESNMDFDAAKRIARGMGQDDVVKVLDDWATTPDKVSIKDKRTRNYVTWDQDVLNRSKMLERDGVTLGANKGPTAALPGLLGKTSSELRAEANALRFPNEDLNINAELAQSAKDYFGVTRSPNETGYIMQDGTRLDLSGRHYAGGYEKKGDRFVPEAGRPDYLGGNRAVDHRELYDLKGIDDAGWSAVEKLMRETGAVRYKPNTGFSIIDGQKVSDKQLKAIVSDFRKNGNSLTVDIDPIGGNSAPKSKTFDRPTVEGVREFIELGANKSPTAALPGLLDDTASRMQRAQEYDFSGYHGTAADVDEFSGMAWASEAPDLANEYAFARDRITGQHPSVGGANVMPIRMKTGNQFNADYLPKTVTVGQFANEMLEQSNVAGRVLSESEMAKARELLDKIRTSAKTEESGPYYSRHDFWNDASSVFGKDGETAIQDLFKLLGFDSVTMREGGGKTVGVFDPQNIRSRFAKFDPAKADSADLLAANPATAALPGLLEQQYMEDSERLLRDSQGLLGVAQRRQNQLNRQRQFYASGGV